MTSAIIGQRYLLQLNRRCVSCSKYRYRYLGQCLPSTKYEKTRSTNYAATYHTSSYKSSIFGHHLSIFKSTKRSYDVVRPQMVTPELAVPDHINRPPYAMPEGPPPETATQTFLKRDKSEIAKLKLACKLASKILDTVENKITVGMTTDEIDKLVHDLAVSHGAYPSPLLYRGFPKSCCTSVNNVACHGIPDLRPLKDGDIVNVDVTVYLNGYHGDSSRTFLIGNVDDSGRRLVEITKKCLRMAIEICKPGQELNKIGEVISDETAKHGFNVMPAFCGHGIGENFHELPDIYHFENDDTVKMEEGMCFTIEPVLSEGSPDVVLLEDGWTAVSVDNSRSAQFEHTIRITETGCEILT